jgi:hypothetical protein
MCLGSNLVGWGWWGGGGGGGRNTKSSTKIDPNSIFRYIWCAKVVNPNILSVNTEQLTHFYEWGVGVGVGVGGNTLLLLQFN